MSWWAVRTHRPSGAGPPLDSPRVDGISWDPSPPHPTKDLLALRDDCPWEPSRDLNPSSSNRNVASGYAVGLPRGFGRCKKKVTLSGLVDS